jgi:hypothetical protein
MNGIVKKMLNECGNGSHLIETDVPVNLQTWDICNAWCRWLSLRRKQHGEFLCDETLRASLLFLADESDAAAVLTAACNEGQNCRKQLWPADGFHTTFKKKFRYAVRTHRSKRGGQLVTDTVFERRSVLESLPESARKAKGAKDDE